MKQLVALAEPLLSTFVPLFVEDPAPSCYLSLFLPLLKPLTFSPEASSVYSHIVTLLNCFVSTEDETLESTLRLCRLEVLEILLEILRVSPRLEPSPESVLMAYCDTSVPLQPREVLLLLGDRGLLSDSEDVRLNALINLDGVENYASNPLYVVLPFFQTFSNV